LSSKARQIRETAVWVSPVWAAIIRVDQCVPASGGACERVKISVYEFARSG
jgi:hypothetical protein